MPKATCPQPRAESCKSITGLLKIFETILGLICLVLITNYTVKSYIFMGNSEHLLFLVVSFAFFIVSFLFVIARVFSDDELSKTLFELLYNIFAFVFYFCASLALLIDILDYYWHFPSSDSEAKIAASVLGLINSLLYLGSCVFSFRSYKGSS